MAFALVVTAGCTPIAAASSPDAASDAPDAPIDAPSTATPACAADPAQCLYQPAPLAIEQIVVTLHDNARIGGTRDIPVVIRYAPTAPLPMPIVVWSHGGANGKTDPTTVLPSWGVAAAEAGYFSISIAHEPRSQSSFDILCGSFEIVSCPTFTYLDYDRPLDLLFVIDTINQMASKPPWAGQIDVAKIAIAGHAGGAGAAFMLDGVPRDIPDVHFEFPSAQPVAFVALSPPAAGSAGTKPDGYRQVTRPTMIATGRGDSDATDSADDRAAVYDLFQPDNKARVFIEDPAAVHTLFELDTAACAATASVEHCQQMTDWVKSSVIAFLDAQVRQSPDAILWTTSTNLAVASANVAEWSTK